MAGIVRSNFLNPTNGEFTGTNENGVPIRLILINIFSPNEPDFIFNEDPGLISNAVQVDDPYEFVGVDSDESNRNLRLRQAFNYFRIGDPTNSIRPLSTVQRRFVIANGSTSEILFTITPTGIDGSGVAAQFSVLVEEIVDAIDSVAFVPEIPEDLSISVNDLQFNETELIIEFASAPGLNDFSIVATTDLNGNFPINLTDNAVITESTDSPGTYQARIDSPEQNRPERLFLRVELEL